MSACHHPTVPANRRVRRRAWVSGLCLIAVTGCTVGPDYRAPQADVPAAWSGPTTEAEPNAFSEQALIHWWTRFNDPLLTSLEIRAVESNLDVRQAEARVRQARAARGVAAAGRWPTVSAVGSATRRRTPGQPVGTTGNLYQAGLDAAWELDLFGGVRRNVEAATSDLQAAAEDRRDVLVTLTAEVALAYVQLRGAQQEIVVARDNLQAQQHVAKLTRERFEGGFVSGLDVANADALVAGTAAQIPPLDQAALQGIYGLSVLLGREPAALVDELTPTVAIPTAPPAVPAGVPSELLRRRPDIRRAEAQIHSATARIGVATADLFPRFTLSGTAGYEGIKPGTLTDWANRFWSIGPSLSWPLFAGHGIRSNIELQKALQEESVIAYRQTVLAALQEVENALIAVSKEQEHHEALVKAVAANRKALGLATQLYTQGQTDFLSVLQAQEALYAAENALVRSTQTVSTNLVALYKALGGGTGDTVSHETGSDISR